MISTKYNPRSFLKAPKIINWNKMIVLPVYIFYLPIFFCMWINIQILSLQNKFLIKK